MTIKKLAEYLDVWLSSETIGFNELFFRLLASLPGGERLEELGYQPFGSGLGWLEVGLIQRTLETVQDAEDVRELIDALLEAGEE